MMNDEHANLKKTTPNPSIPNAARNTMERELSISGDDHPIVLFDGVCNLCNSSVQFIIDRDPGAIFRFAPLQSGLGEMLVKIHGLPEDIETIVLIESGRAYSHSTAALRIARRLQGAWKLLYGFIIIPRFLRNVGYRFVARNRYRWFGKEESCRMPTPELQQRFITMDPMGS